MRKLLVLSGLLAALAISSSASADEYVNGYYRSNGTYVNGYYRSSPDGNPYNNYSTKGNVNPYTGGAGTKNPDSNEGSNSYTDSSPYATPAQPSGNNEDADPQ